MIIGKRTKFNQIGLLLLENLGSILF